MEGTWGGQVGGGFVPPLCSEVCSSDTVESVSGPGGGVCVGGGGEGEDERGKKIHLVLFLHT